MNDAFWGNVAGGVLLASFMVALWFGLISLVIGLVRLISRSGSSDHQGREKPRRHGWVLLVATLLAISVNSNQIRQYGGNSFRYVVSDVLVLFFVVIVIGLLINAVRLLISAIRRRKRGMDFDAGPAGSMDASPPSEGSPRATVGGMGEEFNSSYTIKSFISTLSGVVTRPVGFFAGMPRQGDFRNPLIFAAICAMIFWALGSIFPLLTGTYASLAGLIGNVIFFPIIWAILLFMGAGIYHLLVLLMVRPNAGFEATFRVLAYSSVILLVTWLAGIPIVGILIGPVAGIYCIVLGTIGIKETHSTTTARAAAVVLIPPLVVGLLVALLALPQ